MDEREVNPETRSAICIRPGDYPLGSPQSRAAARIRLQEATGLGRTEEECICFPSNEQPFFRDSEDQKGAAKIQCPLHGKRFEPRFHIYVAAWRWRIELERRWPRLSAKYHRAFAASFPEGHPLRTAIEAITDRDQQRHKAEADAETPSSAGV